MLYNTNNFIDVIKKDFKKIILVFSIINIVATIIYPIFAIFANLGNLYINIIILVTAITYGILDLTIDKKSKFKLKSGYNWLRTIITSVSLVINVYSIYISATNVNGIAIIITTFMIIFWILKLVGNILYDSLTPRLNELGLCLFEDAKPFLTATNKFNITNINIDSKTPPEVLKIAKEAQKIRDNKREKEVNKNIKENFSQIFTSLDENKNEKITLKEVIKNTFEHIENVTVNKESFLKDEFYGNLTKKQLKKLNKKGPGAVDISEDSLSEFIDKLTDNNQGSISSLKRCIKEGKIEFKNEKDGRKFIESFANVLIALQKIIYVCGFDQINKEKISEKQMNALIVALSIVLKEGDIVSAKHNLYLYREQMFINKIKSPFSVLSKNKDKIFDFTKAITPIVDDMLCRYVFVKTGIAIPSVTETISKANDVINNIAKQENKD